LPELQLEQEEVLLAPATGFGTPPIVALKAEKTDITRFASALHAGHSQGWSDRLAERSFSNVFLHSGQVYSYIGIVTYSSISV